MKARCAIVALLAFASITTAQAEPIEWWLNVGGISAHTHAGYNGFNPGLGVVARMSPEFAIGAGAYRNSQRRTSHYITTVYTPFEAAGLRLGCIAGVVDGYRLNHGSAVPVISPLVEWRADRVAVGVSFIPHVAHFTDTAVLAAQVSVRF